MSVTDYADYQTPAAHATAISVTGTPLLHGWNPQSSPFPTVYSLAASGNTSPSFSVAKPGYIIEIEAQYTVAANGALPYLTADLFWKDNASGVIIARERWVIPVTPAGVSNKVYGKGPTKGNLVQIKLSNNDAANAVTVSMGFGETTQHIARDDWRSATVTANALAGGLLIVPQNIPESLILAAVGSIAIGPGLSKTWVLPLYAGFVNISITNSASISLLVAVEMLDPLIPGGNNTIFNTLTSAADPLPFTLPIPRCPAAVVLSVGGGVGTNVTLSVDALEHAS